MISKATFFVQHAVRRRVIAASLAVAVALTPIGRGVGAQDASKESPKSGATEAVRGAVVRLRTLLTSEAKERSEPEKMLSEQVTTEMRELLDVDDLTKRALGGHWNSMTSAQQTTLVTTLREIIEKSFVSQLKENLDYEVLYEAEVRQGADVIVRTVVKTKRKGRPLDISVDYVMHGDGGHWRAYDIITDDVSMLRNYRAQFNRVIARESVEGLIVKMKAKLANPDRVAAPTAASMDAIPRPARETTAPRKRARARR